MMLLLIPIASLALVALASGWACKK